MNQKGLITPIIIIVSLIILVVISYTFFIRPFKVPENAVQPFNRGGIILAEKVTYLFRSPEVGERVLFIPKDSGIEFVGIITKINEENNIKTYSIVSTGIGVPWEVSKDKIIWRVYYPSVSKDEITSTLSSLPQQQTPQPTYMGDETTQLKTYISNDLKIQFKYPKAYDVSEETNNSVSIGTKAENGYIIYLTITKDPQKFTNYKSIKLCTQSSENEHCIATEGWGQKEPISNIKLDDLDAVDFYLGGGVDFAFHIIQTIAQPNIELKMNVAGGGLDTDFKQILSTFKFQ